MKRSRIVAFVGMALGVAAGAAWSCSPFVETSSSPADAGGGETGAAEASFDSSITDATAPDTSARDADADAALPSPCPGDGGTVVFSSSFDNGAGPSLAGWTALVFGDTSITAVASDAGAVARGSINAGNAVAVYAVMTRGPTPPDFAVRFSFAVSSLEDQYIIHQALDEPAGAASLRLSLQSAGWTFGVDGRTVLLGGRGDAGAWHTLTYRLVGGPDGGGLVAATFDTPDVIPIDLSDGTGFYKDVQLGPFWPLPSPAAPLVVDYDNVTVWDCSK